MNSKAETFFTKKWAVWLCALICTALWGSAFPCIKTGYELFSIDSADTASVLLFAGIRFFGAGVMALLIGSILQKKVLLPRRSSWGRIFVLAMFQTVGQYIFFYISLAHTTGVKGSILSGTGTLFAILFACLIFRQEKFTGAKIAGCVIGFIGMVIVNLTGEGITMDFSLLGEGFMILSSVSYAFSTVFLNRFAAKDEPVMLSGWQFMMGGAILIIVGLIAGGHLNNVNLKGILLLAYMMFISAAAYSLWGILLKYNPVSRISIFGFMTPVFGSLLSAVFLREFDSIGASTVLALVLVCAGIYLVNRGTFKKTEAAGRS